MTLAPTLTWSAAGATSYDVQFGTTTPPPSVATGQATATYAPPAPLATGTPYYWQVVAHNSGGTTPGPIWTFTTVPAAPFSDDPLTAGSSVVRAVHITELRTRIDALRARYGLAAYAWTDPPISVRTTVIRAVHVTDMRTALSQAYVAAGRTAPVFTNPNIAGMPIKVVHIAELRAAVVALE